MINVQMLSLGHTGGFWGASMSPFPVLARVRGGGGGGVAGAQLSSGCGKESADCSLTPVIPMHSRPLSL